MLFLTRVIWPGVVLMLAVASLSAQEAAAPKVAISAAYKADIVDEVEFIGRGEAVDKVELVARVSGFIQNVDAADGSTVKQGDVLYRIEPDEYEAAYYAALSREPLPA